MGRTWDAYDYYYDDYCVACGDSMPWSNSGYCSDKCYLDSLSPEEREKELEKRKKKEEEEKKRKEMNAKIDKYREKLKEAEIIFPKDRIDEVFVLRNGLRVEKQYTVEDASFKKRDVLKVEMDLEYDWKGDNPRYYVQINKYDSSLSGDKYDDIRVYITIGSNGASFLDFVRNPENLIEALKKYNVKFI